jgi:hypothetical protein
MYANPTCLHCNRLVVLTPRKRIGMKKFFLSEKYSKKQSAVSKDRNMSVQACSSAKKEHSVTRQHPCAADSKLNLPDLHPLDGATAEGNSSCSSDSKQTVHRDK